MREVATLAQVAPSTVSRVLNGSKSVSPEARDRVMRAIADTNYQPNLLGRTLRTSKTHTLAFILPNLDSAPNIAAIREAEKHAQRHGYGMLVADTTDSPDVERQIIQNLNGRRIDGVLCTPVNDPQTIATLFSESDTPVVFLFSRPIEVSGRTTTAVIDHSAAVRECAAHIVENGHTRIALFVRQSAFADAAGYAPNFSAALRLGGLADGELTVHAGGEDAGCVERVNTLMSGPNPPTAIIVDIGSAPTVLMALRHRGICPGADVSFVTLGGSAWLEAMNPPISSIEVDVQAFIGKGANALLEMVEQGARSIPSVFEPSTYRRRGSVRAIR
jgi:LacI family transcriptional regulator